MSTIDPNSVPVTQDAPLDSAAAIETAGDASASPSAEPSGAPPANPPPPAPVDQPAEPSPSSASAEQTRGRPFEPGRSGNPAGRPKGSRNRATQLAEALIHDQGEALVSKALKMALAGDAGLLRALLTTLVPRRPHRTVEVALPEIKTAADAVAASSALLVACSRGEISPAEASEVMALITTHVRIVDVAVLAQRIAALEEQQQK